MINFHCRHYRASVPCRFNKSEGAECPSCRSVSEFRERVLFIKLDAIGDVLRSASLLPAVIARHDAPYVAWLTRRESVGLVRMMRHVDEVIELSEVGLARIRGGNWSCVYSLSNDMASASLASMAAETRPVVGYRLSGGTIMPSNAAAERWLEMAAFDRIKRQNIASYQRRMLDILEHPGPYGPPALAVDEDARAAAGVRVDAVFPGSTRQRVAINVGAGGRWPKKMLDVRQIHRLIGHLLRRFDVDVMLVGGALEVEKADAVLALCGADSRVRAVLTPDSIPAFVATLTQADALLCGDTLALHIATAIGLPTIAVFGPTSAAEIADFDGLIVKVLARELDCLGCYADCRKRENCMTLLDVEHLAALVEPILARAHRRTGKVVDYRNGIHRELLWTSAAVG